MILFMTFSAMAEGLHVFQVFSHDLLQKYHGHQVSESEEQRIHIGLMFLINMNVTLSLDRVKTVEVLLQ